jgi:signal transduction histidine kinase
LATARSTAANLAHALKTPVATLALDLRGEPARAAQVARIDATIRHHLARARAEMADRRASTPLRPAIDDLVAAVGRLHADRHLAFAVEVPDGWAVAVDPHDLDELIGNVLDNAAKHARSRVRIAATKQADDGRFVRVAIMDDGAGIAPADRPRAAEPGVRLDELGDGHGFGLSIVASLVALYGGTVTFDDAAGGGLAVVLGLPVGRS